jgi:hypothetical protein
MKYIPTKLGVVRRAAWNRIMNVLDIKGYKGNKVTVMERRG